MRINKRCNFRNYAPIQNLRKLIHFHEASKGPIIVVLWGLEKLKAKVTFSKSIEMGQTRIEY